MRQARFTSNLDTRLVDEFDNTHMLLAPLEYECALLDMAIVVPRDFVTDFASVPRIVLAYLFFGGKGKRAAVVHDWLYSGGLRVTRDLADEVFREALVATGYSRITVDAMYLGVRIGGESRFNQPNVPQSVEVARMIRRAAAVTVSPMEAP